MPDDSKIICYIARHGVTSLNASNSFRGNKNPELNSEGLADAHKLAKMFESIEVCHIVCSDRIRATTTAEIIAAKKNLPVHKSENLRALNVGEFSGLKRDKENTDALQVYLDSPDETIPGGESLNDFKRRIDPCIQEAIDIADNAGLPILLVAHSSIIHEVGSLVMGSHSSILVDPGGIAVIYLSNGELKAKPYFKKAVATAPSDHADTVS